MTLSSISIKQLKERGCGTISGYIYVSTSKSLLCKALLFDPTDNIELVLFGDVILKPRCLYKIAVEELILGGCVPVRQDCIELVADETEGWKVQSDSLKPPKGKRVCTIKTPRCTQFSLYISKKSNYIDNDSFHFNALCYAEEVDRVIEVIVYMRAEWFLYITSGNFYSISTLTGILLDFSTTIINKKDLGANISITVIEDVTSPCQKIRESRRFVVKSPMLFEETKKINDLYHVVSIECEVVSTDSLNKSGFICVADSQNSIENIAFTPIIRTLPATFIPGARFLLLHLLVKAAAEGRRFLSVTTETQARLLSLPEGPGLRNLTSLHTLNLSRQTGLVNVVVVMSCILSLTITPGCKISCKLSVKDSSGLGQATLHVRGNPSFVKELFGITEEDRASLEGVQLEIGKVDWANSDGVLGIFSRSLSTIQRFHIRADARHDTSHFFVPTVHGPIQRPPRTILFPLSIRRVSATEVAKHAISGSTQ